MALFRMRCVASLALLFSAKLQEGSGENIKGKDLHMYPPLHLVQSVIASTASEDFEDNVAAYVAANVWQEVKAGTTNKPTTYLVCAEYRQGRETRAHLERIFSVSAVQPLSHTPTHGSCFMVRASPAQAASMKKEPTSLLISSVAPFLCTLKLAPDLLNHHHHATSVNSKRFVPSSGRLQTIYGDAMRMDHVRGLTLRLSPGFLPAQDPGAHALMKSWTEDLMSDSLDMYYSSFWSDPSVLDDEFRHPADHFSGKVRVHSWSRAAELLHRFSESHGKAPGEICSWHRITLSHTDDDLLLIEGTPSVSLRL